MQPRDGVLAASCVEVHHRLTTIRKMCICINDLGHQIYQHGVAAFFLSCIFLEVADAASCRHHWPNLGTMIRHVPHCEPV